ncbi:murein L,D-transpeptidase [Bailinhaonella thermotolerans]|uniref:Murein L,D-transpeptidase n=2 Tax=Bailinhaonella thermotolerans TaxID=1070861 RepID=A0A3A4AIU9_9ACTN|nr:murein L,D-transpeptidase [Bailinhaonella thermotolerans]
MGRAARRGGVFAAGLAVLATGAAVQAQAAHGERAGAGLTVAARQAAAPPWNTCGHSDPPVLRAGMESELVACVKRRLVKLGYDPGSYSEHYDDETRQAIWAFQKVNGQRARDRVDAATWRALAHPRAPRKLVSRGAARRVEINLSKQVLTFYLGHRPVLITHISTGSGRRFCSQGWCRRARTPVGDFRVYRRVPRWERSPLGYMYKPAYFHGGYAVHGSVSVPPYPDSHGCVRVPLHVSERLFPALHIGTRVHLRR